MNFSVGIVYDPPGGKKPLRLVRIEDPLLLAEVAAAAIRESEARAVILSNADDGLARLQREHAERLRRLLGPLVSTRVRRVIRTPRACSTRARGEYV